MTNIFLDVNEARELSRRVLESTKTKVKKELISELPGRISRNAKRGELFVAHYTDHFSIVKTIYYVKAVKEIKEQLINKGYHVESFISEYNGVYNSIGILICWDIESLKNDPYSLAKYEEHKADGIIF